MTPVYDRTIFIRAKGCKVSSKDPSYKSTMKFKLDEKIESKWREPGLLQVLKEIRREVSTVYYGVNSFGVCASSEELFKALLWLRQKRRQNQSDELNFYIYVKSPGWTGIAYWMNLAFLAYESEAKTKHNNKEGGATTKREIQQKMVKSAATFKLSSALDEAVELGLQARDRKSSHAQLEDQFVMWARSTVKKLASDPGMALFTLNQIINRRWFTTRIARRFTAAGNL